MNNVGTRGSAASEVNDTINGLIPPREEVEALAAEGNAPAAPSLEAIKRAAQVLGLKRRALGSIFEAAFAPQPIAGERYTGEILDLGCWISKSSEDACDDMDKRLLAMPFGYTDMLDDAQDDRHPFLRDATIDLVRAVAVYFVRTRAFWEATCEETAAAESGAS